MHQPTLIIIISAYFLAQLLGSIEIQQLLRLKWTFTASTKYLLETAHERREGDVK